ncbi:hypothetical protein [Methylomagnum ishizawai]|uniref:hypothetical protein n=1 Tax=Methylomagnum ishizawai TaxID=1760988 RepID=UPI001C33092E|nr:hypothetical protein [Methylomagnum ishizawai]BBL75460.1 hypothetical protein MishRS11D_25580 [Methylomagnum ishizawai]
MIDLALLTLGTALVGHRAYRALADLDALYLVPALVGGMGAALVVEIAVWAVSP